MSLYVYWLKIVSAQDHCLRIESSKWIFYVLKYIMLRENLKTQVVIPEIKCFTKYQNFSTCRLTRTAMDDTCKSFRRKPSSILDNGMTISGLNFFKTFLRWRFSKNSTEICAKYSVNDCWRFPIWKRLC